MWFMYVFAGALNELLRNRRSDEQSLLLLASLSIKLCSAFGSVGKATFIYIFVAAGFHSNVTLSASSMRI
jgi:hypothetical protein